MKRLLWCLKIGILCAALLSLSPGYRSRVIAQDEGMGIEGGGAMCNDPCTRSSTNQCFCVGGALCHGCFIANGTGGCGTCSQP
jgi:hypothetical protein